MKKAAVLLIYFSIVAAAQLFADDATTDSVKYRFNPIVVTASKIENSQRDLPASISVINEQQIRMAPSQSVLEIVKNHVPGVFVTERAVMGFGIAESAAGGLSIRGVGGSPVTGVLVLRDGRPDIMGIMGHPISDAYTSEGVERIEVVRGPASFLYGTNAMGGVINIITKRMHEDGFRTSISGGYGTFDSQRLVISHGGNRGKFDYHVTGALRKTDGHRDFSDYDGDFSTAHAGYQLSSSTKLEFNGHFSDIHLLDPGRINVPLAGLVGTSNTT